jgi:hypothetical protein
MSLDLEETTSCIQRLQDLITTIPVAKRKPFQDDVNHIQLKLVHVQSLVQQLGDAIRDITEYVTVIVGDNTQFNVPRSILDTYPESMLAEVVQLHLNDDTDSVVRFPTASAEYFPIILSIMKNPRMWSIPKTRTQLFGLASEPSYFNITIPQLA